MGVDTFAKNSNRGGGAVRGGLAELCPSAALRTDWKQGHSPTTTCKELRCERQDGGKGNCLAASSRPLTIFGSSSRTRRRRPHGRIQDGPSRGAAGGSRQIPSVMQTGRGARMMTLSDSLLELVKKDLVEPEEAYANA